MGGRSTRSGASPRRRSPRGGPPSEGSGNANCDAETAVSTGSMAKSVASAAVAPGTAAPGAAAPGAAAPGAAAPGAAAPGAAAPSTAAPGAAAASGSFRSGGEAQVAACSAAASTASPSTACAVPSRANTEDGLSAASSKADQPPPQCQGSPGSQPVLAADSVATPAAENGCLGPVTPVVRSAAAATKAVAKTLAGAAHEVQEAAANTAEAVVQTVAEELKSRRMQSVLSSPHVFWRHPIARIAVTFMILGQDFFIYAEDPVNDSHVRANFPGMGHIMGIITLHTSETVGLAFLRLFLVLVSITIGGVLGRLFLVRLLRQRWKITLFEGCEGAILTVSLSIVGVLFLFALIYNVLIPSWAKPITGASMDILLGIGTPSLQYRHVNQTFQALSGSVDLLAILMVADQVYQDNMWYPQFAPYCKRVWNGWHGRVRVIAFWVIFITGVAVVTACVRNTGKDTADGDYLWEDEVLGGTTENVRSLLAATIVFTDLFTVVQDWSFPMFHDALEVEVPKVAGTFVEGLRCSCFAHLARKLPKLPDCLHRLEPFLPKADWLDISISGKWLTYGPVVGVMIIDLFCTRTQIMYTPSIYGQYVDPTDSRIVTIIDEEYLAKAYSWDGVLTKPELVTYEARWNITTGEPITASALTDHKLNSQYVDSSAKYLGFLIALFFIACFVVMILIANWRLQRGLDLGKVISIRENSSSSRARKDEGSVQAGAGKQ